MRLVRIEDSIRAGSALHAVLRDSSGHGTVLHWSHLLDTLVLIVASPFAAVLGWHGGLTAAALLFGPLCMGALGVAVVWAVAPLCKAPLCQGHDRQTQGGAPLWLAALVLGLTPSIGQYGLIGTVHHHVPLVVTAALSCGWAVRAVMGGSGRAGIWCGVCTGTGLWFSPEALAPGLMAVGGIWAAWLVQPSLVARQALGQALAGTGAGLLVMTGLAWVLDPPAAGYLVAEPDRISVMYVWLAGGVAVAGGIAWRTGARPLAILSGGVASVLWLHNYPQLLRGTEGLMSGAEARLFFDGILEMLPVSGPVETLAYLGTGLLAAAFLFAVAVKRRSWLIAYTGLCAVALLILASRHVRFAAYPAALAAALLPVAVAAAARWRPAQAIRLRMALMLAVLGLPVLAGTIGAAVLPGPKDETGLSGPTCDLRGAIALVRPLGDAIVLAPVNENPTLLWNTRARTVGTLYHRGIAGYVRLHTAWSDPADPYAAVLATQARYVLICPQPGLAGPEQSLTGQLDRNAPPPWLEFVAAQAGYVLYRLTP